MKKILLIFAVLVMVASTAFGANYYVRTAAGGPYGTSSGADWNNAYNGLSGINWSGKTGGDTIWLAGGSYTTGMDIGASGTSDLSRLVIKRATANDTECTSAAGWLAGFDSQVISEGNGIIITSRDYITIDGQVSNGIRIHIPTAGYSGIWFNYSPSNYVTLRYLQIEGKGYQVDFSAGANTAIYATSNTTTATNLLIEHCDLKYCVTDIKIANWTNVTVQYSAIHHNDATDAGSHENVLYDAGCNNVIFRYNICYLNSAEGFFLNGSGDNHQAYGNLFYDSQYAISEKTTVTGTNWKVYNNTVSNCSQGIAFAGTDSTGELTNNLSVNSGFTDNSPGLVQTTNINTSTNPFVDEPNKDFHLLSTAAPRDAGTALSVNYNLDLDGNVRGVDGFWDIGAYEYGGVQPVTLKPPFGAAGTIFTVGGAPAFGAN